MKSMKKIYIMYLCNFEVFVKIKTYEEPQYYSLGLDYEYLKLNKFFTIQFFTNFCYFQKLSTL